MSEVPPPLPVAEEPIAPTVEAARLAPPPAPLLWRSLAFLVDATLIGLFGYLVTTRILLPDMKPDELAVFNGWMAEMEKYQAQLLKDLETGRITDPLAVFRLTMEKAKDVPAGVAEVLSFTSSCMTLFYWIGFAGMEIATGGASFGKKIFRLRVASFPHAEKPGILDSVIRSGWKAMAIGSANPFIMLFAIVDAHWPLFNPLRRSLHDLLCRTLVLDARFDPPEKPKSDDAADDE